MELLTVIAIIAVLATLVTASLSNAQRKGRKAVSMSNLKQIAIAFNLYADDRDKRPQTFRQLVETKYLKDPVLICPEDRIVQNWAGILEKQDAGRQLPGDATQGNPGRDLPAAGPGSEFAGVDDIAHSYFKSFDYPDVVWDQIDKDTMGGLAACQLHGIGRQRKGEEPSLATYQGLVLRVLKDGAVVPRQVFFDAFGTTGNFGDGNISGPSSGPSTGFPGTIPPAGTSQLPLFLDPAE